MEELVGVTAITPYLEYCYYICRNVRMQDVRMCEINPVKYNKVTKIFLLPEAVFCPEKIDKM